ncbi:MAG: Fic family protein [Microbacteriaceae bacterium]|nr:Fic family protein [Microbacteriaceae bacterium]
MVVLFADDFSSAATRKRRLADGAIVALARGVWTDEVHRPPAEVVARHWALIVGRMLPTAVVTYRSGFDLRPVDGQLFVSHPRRTSLTLPGLQIHPDGRTDHRHPDDVPLDSAGLLFGASRGRALVDNAETRGRPSSTERRLSSDELHDAVVQLVAHSTPRQVETVLGQVDEQANAAAATRIRAIVEAAQGRGATLNTGSAAMRAAQTGQPYDQARLALLTAIAAELEQAPLVQRFITDPNRARYAPFYEAYFSNYIEGSTLTADEAERVVFDNADVGKPADAHDIRTTYEIVANDDEMTHTATSADEFLDLLRDRHAVMMAAHHHHAPGQWKTLRNQAGATIFVEPELVPGTLRAGWDAGARLTDPFQRATYVMFMITEVHPFADGNGRSARVAMNTELATAGMHRVIIPTIARQDYISALSRATTGAGVTHGLYRVLDHLQRWVSAGEFSTLDDARRYLRVTNAQWESATADRAGIRLQQLRVGEMWELPANDPPSPGSSQSTPPSAVDVAIGGLPAPRPHHSGGQPPAVEAGRRERAGGRASLEREAGG